MYRSCYYVWCLSMFDFKGSFWTISDMILQLGVLETSLKMRFIRSFDRRPNRCWTLQSNCLHFLLKYSYYQFNPNSWLSRPCCDGCNGYHNHHTSSPSPHTFQLSQWVVNSLTSVLNCSCVTAQPSQCSRRHRGGRGWNVLIYESWN